MPHIREQLDRMGIDVPLIGDFHYNGHRLLTDYPACAEALAKYRINPGNVGNGDKRDRQFAQMIEAALRCDKPVRIGVNWGSLDQELLRRADGRERAPAPSRSEPKSGACARRWSRSALESAPPTPSEIGLAAERIVISAKVSGVQDLIAVYRELAARCDYALHLGLTEAGMGTKGIVASAAALALLLQEGIGDTIRVSLTPQPGESRTQEVRGRARRSCRRWACARSCRSVTACPGCGRTTSTTFQELAKQIDDYLRAQMPVWRALSRASRRMKVAVMGCIVNGPGESKHADIGISLPGTGEAPAAPVFIDGEKALTLRGDNIAERVPAHGRELRREALRRGRRRCLTSPQPGDCSMSELRPSEACTTSCRHESRRACASGSRHGARAGAPLRLSRDRARRSSSSPSCSCAALGEATDIVEKEMYTFEDRGGERLTLRPENTAGVVRAVIEPTG